MKRWFSCVLLCVLPAAAQSPQPPRSGIEFQSADVRAMQADDFANPATLWVERGMALWNEPRGASAASCASCHGDPAKSMHGVSARYPAWVEPLARVATIEQRIDACVVAKQNAPALALESPEMLALTALIARESRGVPVTVDVAGPAASTYERGRRLYSERQGQLNLACTHCHDASWGRTLFAEKVSQGQPVDWPAYRLEWQTLGSLERRLRACYFGVRAELPAFGSADLVALELYLAQRAKGLPSSAPGVRR